MITSPEPFARTSSEPFARVNPAPLTPHEALLKVLADCDSWIEDINGIRARYTAIEEEDSDEGYPEVGEDARTVYEEGADLLEVLVEAIGSAYINPNPPVLVAPARKDK